MLGRTASSLFWMARQMERAENIARLAQVGHRISITPDASGGYREDWKATLASAGASAGCLDAFAARGAKLTAAEAQRFLVFDRGHPGSIHSCLEAARNNGRSVRTALTREMWEAFMGRGFAYSVAAAISNSLFRYGGVPLFAQRKPVFCRPVSGAVFMRALGR